MKKKLSVLNAISWSIMSFFFFLRRYQGELSKEGELKQLRNFNRKLRWIDGRMSDHSTILMHIEIVDNTILIIAYRNRGWFPWRTPRQHDNDVQRESQCQLLDPCKRSLLFVKPKKHRLLDLYWFKISTNFHNIWSFLKK